jgi:hypothetical protein
MKLQVLHDVLVAKEEQKMVAHFYGVSEAYISKAKKQIDMEEGFLEKIMAKVERVNEI